MHDWLIHHIKDIESLKAKGEYQQAKRLVESLLLKHTDDYRLYEELADIFLFSSQIEKAKSAIAVAISLNPQSFTGMYLSWYIAVTEGDFTRGITLLDRANKGFPNNPEILRNLWWAYVVTGEVQKWIIYLKRALNLAPGDELIMEDLWVALLSEWNMWEWEEFLRKAWKEYRIKELRSLMRI